MQCLLKLKYSLWNQILFKEIICCLCFWEKKEIYGDFLDMHRLPRTLAMYWYWNLNSIYGFLCFLVLVFQKYFLICPSLMFFPYIWMILIIGLSAQIVIFYYSQGSKTRPFWFRLRRIGTGAAFPVSNPVHESTYCIVLLDSGPARPSHPSRGAGPESWPS